MPSFDHSSGEIATSTTDHDGSAPADDFGADRRGSGSAPGGSSNPSRMLEVAARTADELVANARTEAESLVTTAQATAQQIGEASRNEAATMADELSRTRAEQLAEIERERESVLGRLEDEKASLEARIATLSEMEAEQRDRLRGLLTEQLAQLDAERPVAPADDTH
jgi:cell division septum initiation protein DivIVA